MNSNLAKFTPYALALLRIVAAYMFLLHGTAKFFEFPVSMTGGNGSVPLMSMYGIGGILEIGGGILLLLGLFTRPVAFLLSGMMAYAYFFMHATAEKYRSAFSKPRRVGTVILCSILLISLCRCRCFRTR
ncbi:DoxX family protein [Actinobacillus pleuropneumoniae]|nr:DoxX family protein [Actinobacillus pleuropneumoniae]